MSVLNYVPNVEEVEGAYWFGPVHHSVSLSVTLILDMVKPLKIVNIEQT